MRYGIVQIAYALTDAAWAFSGLTPDMWKAYPSKSWAQGVSGGVQGFMDLFDTMEERGYSAAWFSIKTKILEGGVRSMASVAAILWHSKKYFTVKLDPNFIKNISKNVLGFAALASQLDKMLVTEKTVTTTSSSWGGLSSSSSTKTVRERKDLSLVKDVAYQMTQAAAILYMGRKFFSVKLDPNYMKNMSTNVKDFSKLVNYLSNQNTGFGSKLMSVFGWDPVSQAAYGMVRMASAFDVLAKSLNRFSSSIKSIDGQKVNMIRKLTANIAILSAMDSKMFNNMLSVLEKRAGVFSKLLDVQGRSNDMSARPNVGDRPGGGQREVWARKSKDQGPTDAKGENALVKLDRIAELLLKINKNTSGIDDYISFAQGHAKKVEKSMKKMSKKDDDD